MNKALIQVLASWCFWGLAHAQANADLPEVRVSGGLIEQRQFDTPGSVQRIDAERIRSSGPQVNLSDVLTTVPGVVALNRNNYAQDIQISIRGFGSRAAFGLRGIKLLADGIPASTPDGQGQASTISLTSVDRIEVLSGPLAQIHGNATGGVIQTFTREAADHPEALTQLYVGSFGLRRSDWQLSGRTGHVGVVADFSTLDTQGYRANSAARRSQLNTVFTLDSAPGTRHKFIVNLFEMPLAQDPVGLNASQLATPWVAGIRSVEGGVRKTVHQEQVGWVMNHRIQGDLSLSTRLYRGDRSNLQYQAGTGSSANEGTWVGLQRQYHGLGAQLQGRHDAAIPVLWTAGLELDQSGEQRQGGASLSGQINGLPNRNEWNQANTQDVFVQANWLLSDHYTLVTGVRNSSVKLRSADQYLIDRVDGSGRVTYHATNPVLGLTWHTSPQINLYANTGRGFETPTLAEIAYTVAPSANPPVQGTFNSPLRAATSRHTEIGAKYAPGDGSRLNIAWFEITTQNEIVTDFSSGGRTAFKNATQTQRQGLELGWLQRWGKHWRSDASLTAMRAVYDPGFSTVSVSGVTPTITTIATGNRLPAIPDRLGFAALHWSQSGWGAQPFGWMASLEWLGRSRLWANDTNTAAAAGYGMVNVRLRHRQAWAGGSLEPYLAVDNINDQRAIGSVIVNQAASRFFEPALPRNWVLGLQAKWAL
ncbi:MAG: TonB-dependent receptor [Alphaproteobacteria bacterium]|nr:TonB-dependent receptor [Alphaproteobacteria bacterium]